MRRFTRIPFLFCVGGVFALYARCVIFSFIGLDDAAYTFRNPFVAGGLSVANVVEAFTNLRHGGIWMPVTYVSYMLDSSVCRWTGLPLMGEMHLVNVLLHTVNFILLWKLIHLLTANHQPPTTIIAAMAAMIWAVHPLRAEPVAWIAARKELLWTLFALAGLISWIKGWERRRRDEGETRNMEHGAQNSKLSTISYQLSTIIFCALACLAKPTAMCFPFLLFLVMWWMRKEGKVGEWAREEASDAGGDKRQATVVPCAKSQLHNNSLRLCVSALKTNHPPSPLTPQLIIIFLLAATTAAIAAYSQTHVAGQDSVALYAAPFAHRLVNALSAIGYYIRATFWPLGLHIDCRSVPGLWPLDAGWNFSALAIASFAALAMIAIANRRRPATHPSPLTPHPSPLNSTRSKRLIIFSALWFLISLLPTLGLFGNFGMEAHADRFAYLPLMALSFLLAGFLRRSGIIDAQQPTAVAAIGNREAEGGRAGARLSHNYQLSTTNYQLPTVIVSALLSVVTFQQLSYWRDDWASHQRVLDCDSGHPRAMVHVADARCSRQRDFDGGISLYRKALSLSGTVPAGCFNVADVKARLAYALASRGGYDDFTEVKKIGAEVLRDFRLDRRGMMLDALGTAFLAEGDPKRAAILFKASIEAPDRFWPKTSTRRKLESCMQ